MEKIYYLSVKDDVPATGYWDHEFIKDIFEDIPQTDRQIVVIPGAYQADSYDAINTKLKAFNKILVIVTSDEECKFNVNKLEHPDMIIYSQYGNGGKMFPLGYAPGTREALKEMGLQERKYDYFFAGQVTHYRRERLVANLIVGQNISGEIVGTDGFAKGLEKKDYMEKMAQSLTVPCPSGAVAVDSFRFYEACEAGVIPIADDIPPLKSGRDHYWSRLFGNPPFPIYTDPSKIPSYIEVCKKKPELKNQIAAWWVNWKYRFKQQLRKDLGVPEEDLVVVIPVSPIPSHPDTRIIEETIASIRVHLPDAPIVVTIDGVRKEQKDRWADYQEFIRRFIWKCNFEYKNVLPVIFGRHHHQSGMIRTILPNLRVPLMLYVEHDTPLTPDMEIPFDDLKQVVKSGAVNVVRFHFESFIPKEHMYLMEGKEGHFMKTVQWSQRPHLASVEYYKRIVEENFTKDSNCFIEDKMHSVVQGKPWEDHRVVIYHPEGSIKRSYNLDGREGDYKFDKEQIW